MCVCASRPDIPTMGYHGYKTLRSPLVRLQGYQSLSLLSGVCQSVLRVLPTVRNSVCLISAFPTHSVLFFSKYVPAGSPSRCGDVVVYVFGVNQESLPTPFYSLLASISVFMALSAVFHSKNSPDNSLLSHTVLPDFFLPHWSFLIIYTYIFLYEIHTYFFMKVSFSPDIILCG